MSNFKVLFICKKRVDSYGISFGLLNSASMICESLGKVGIESSVVCPVDANGIDKEVYNYKPTHVVIHAIWVPPEKIRELCRRYPSIVWNIRIHSKPAFLAMEGIASDWIGEYSNVQLGNHNFWLSANSVETYELVKDIFRARSVMLPNTYTKPAPPADSDLTRTKVDFQESSLNVACFGAIRPLKNTYAQAAAAIRLANRMNLHLDFHINSGREEQGGDRVTKNLKSMFSETHHNLIEHDWYSHSVLVYNILPKMDLGMQVSMTETFNIVAADMVAAGVPTIGSDDIYWMSWLFHSDPNNLDQMGRKLRLAKALGKFGVWLNKIGLIRANKKAVLVWMKYLNDSANCLTKMN